MAPTSSSVLHLAFHLHTLISPSTLSILIIVTTTYYNYQF